MKGTTDELLATVDELLDLVNPLATNHHPPDGNQFLNIFEGIYRRNVFSLLSVRFLATKNELFGDKALDLVRAMIEDTVAIEYMVAFGKRRLARKFKRFLSVQMHEELEFVRRLGLNPVGLLGFSVEDIKDIDRKYKKVKKEFTHRPSGTDLHSWIGMDVDKMLVILAEAIKSKKKKYKITLNDIELTSRGYIHCNRKNHLNPLDVISFMSTDNHKEIAKKDLDEALVFGASCLVRLSSRYIDEISQQAKKNEYIEIGKKLKDIFKRMDS